MDCIPFMLCKTLQWRIHVVSCCVMTCHGMPCHIMSCHVTRWQWHLITRYHFRHGFSQWEEALLCNAFSHWPSPYQEVLLCIAESIPGMIPDHSTKPLRWHTIGNYRRMYAPVIKSIYYILLENYWKAYTIHNLSHSGHLRLSSESKSEQRATILQMTVWNAFHWKGKFNSLIQISMKSVPKSPLYKRSAFV